MPPKAQAWARLSADDQLAAVRQLVMTGQAASTMAYRLTAPPKEIAKLATQVRRQIEEEAQAGDGGLASDSAGKEEQAAEIPASAHRPGPSDRVGACRHNTEADRPDTHDAAEPEASAVVSSPVEAPPDAEQAVSQDHGRTVPEQDPWLTYRGTLNWKRLNRDQRDMLLTAAITAGLTAQKIADRFQNASRSAIIGRAHRLNLQFKGGHKRNPYGPRKSSAPAGPTEARPAPPKRGRKMKLVAGVPQVVIGGSPKAASQWDFKGRAEQRAASVGLAAHLVTGEARRPVDDMVAPVSLRLSLLQLTERTCRWPHGDPRADDFSFCGHDTRFESAYCAYHRRIAFTPLSQRQASSLKAAERIR